jgi:hypothetical protein
MGAESAGAECDTGKVAVADDDRAEMRIGCTGCHAMAVRRQSIADALDLRAVKEEDRTYSDFQF